MSTTHDPDRLLRAWLDLMPNEAPDRAIAAVLQATQAAPQMRGLRLRGRWRSPVNRLTLVAAGAVLLAVLVGGAALLAGSPHSTPSPVAIATGLSTPSPAVLPSATALVAGVAADLQDDWLGAHHDVVSLGADVGTHLKLTANGLSITSPNVTARSLLSSGAASTPEGKLRLGGQAGGGAAACSATAEGLYDTALSTSKETLTITLVSDTCPERSMAVAGTWWRSNCKAPPCYGDIDPGTYGTEYFLPGMQKSTDWAPVYGALQFTTTTPWAEAVDAPTHVILVPGGEYAKWTADGGPVAASDILVFAQPRAILHPATCPDPPQVDDSKAHSASGLLSYLRADPNLTVSSGPAITVDGHPGRVVDLRMNSSSTVSCFDSTPGEEFLMTPFAQDFAWYTLGITDNQRVRLILVDLGPDSVVGIAIEANASNWDAMLAEALPIVESFTFK